MKIYMFHYVTKNFNYHHFDVSLFEKKIKELVKKYKIISLKEYDELLKNNTKIDDNYIMLTFDDGTLDHYYEVYPILKKYNCSGLFFLTSSIFNGKILTIQIIHKLLSLINVDELYDFLMKELENMGVKYDEKLIDNYDTGKVAIFKQLLQYKLPIKIRKEIIEKLIKKYQISIDVNDYYISLEKLREMKDNGMFFGAHTLTHQRLTYLPKEEQENEIVGNIEDLLTSNLIYEDLIAFSYPFGDYNDDIIEILKKNNVKYAFLANELSINDKLLLDRIDCKYF